MPLTCSDPHDDLAQVVEAATPDAWREYERRKRAWMLTHPEADAHEVFDACKRIAEELGL